MAHERFLQMERGFSIRLAGSPHPVARTWREKNKDGVIDSPRPVAINMLGPPYQVFTS